MIVPTLRTMSWMHCRLSQPSCWPSRGRSWFAQLKTGLYRKYAMTKKVKAKSHIFEAVHETASDLHRLGFIDKRNMHKFDALCLDPVPNYDSEKIRALRDHLQLSQAVLAAVLNTSLSTVRKWEGGEKHPSGPSLKLLHLLDRKGLEAVL
jgi:putative transcriptional regulator